MSCFYNWRQSVNAWRKKEAGLDSGQLQRNGRSFLNVCANDGRSRHFRRVRLEILLQKRVLICGQERIATAGYLRLQPNTRTCTIPFVTQWASTYRQIKRMTSGLNTNQATIQETKICH